MRTSHRSALIFVHTAVLLFGLAGVLAKLTPLSAPVIVLGRVVFGGLSLAMVLVVHRTRIRWHTRRDLAALATSGVLLAVHWTAFFEAVQVSNVAIALLAFSTFPLFTTVLEPVLLRTRPGRVDVLAALLILPGVYLIVPTLNTANATTQGAAWGVFAGLSFALLSIWNRRLTLSYPSIVINLYQDATAALVLLPAVFFIGVNPTQLFMSLWELVVLGVVCTALAHTLFIEGMRTVTAQAASLIAALEPVWGIIFALLFLSEVPSLRTLLGGVLILSAVVLPACGDRLAPQQQVRRPVVERRGHGPLSQ